MITTAEAAVALQEVMAHFPEDLRIALEMEVAHRRSLRYRLSKIKWWVLWVIGLRRGPYEQTP